MDELIAYNLDLLFNKILLKSENQHEFLLGDCKSDFNLTSTQEHILMLLSEERLTSTELSRRLSITQAAVTKAIKNLVKNDLLLTEKDQNDGRITYFSLTDIAWKIASEHKSHHSSTLDHYKQLLTFYSITEQEVINSFLVELNEGLDSI